MPLSAKLLASVAPLVNTISLAVAPIVLAICSRAVSTAFFAFQRRRACDLKRCRTPLSGRATWRPTPVGRAASSRDCRDRCSVVLPSNFAYCSARAESGLFCLFYGALRGLQERRRPTGLVECRLQELARIRAFSCRELFGGSRPRRFHHHRLRRRGQDQSHDRRS